MSPYGLIEDQVYNSMEKYDNLERDRRGFLRQMERFIGRFDYLKEEAQEFEAPHRSNAKNECGCADCQKQKAANTACCDSTGVNMGSGNQIVNINVGDTNTNTNSKETVKKNDEVAAAPVAKTKKTSSSGTRTVVVREPSVVNNYYGYGKTETNQTVRDAVQPRRSQSSSYDSYDRSSQTTTTKRSYGTTEEEDCWPTLKPSLVDKYGLHYKSDGRVYQEDGTLYKGSEQPFMGGVQTEDEARNSESSNLSSSSSYSSTTTTRTSGGGELKLKPGYRRGPKGAVIDKNGNYPNEDPFIR
ncbi:hypothetical protein SDC9_21701 [bioreactor metagenome]|uniref:Uncharacterized protein n=1 Tax=bioreactor metagenome TaxID=1076179 RepID=A0A644UAH1_9ZZZZ